MSCRKLLKLALGAQLCFGRRINLSVALYHDGMIPQGSKAEQGRSKVKSTLIHRIPFCFLFPSILPIPVWQMEMS